MNDPTGSVVALPGFLSAGQVRRRLGISRTKFYRLLKAKKLPQPIDDEELGRVWMEDDVEVYVAKVRERARAKRDKPGSK
jgi:predicted DNA-binding transcriptional regulator AlpA